MNINDTTRSLTKDKIKSLLRDIPCIGEIKRQGKDAAGNLLEADYYYDLENDDDKERRSVLISLKGGKNLGLRSCRKTHKQYYWKKPSKKQIFGNKEYLNIKKMENSPYTTTNNCFLFIDL